MNEEQLCGQIDILLSHVWMVRTFVKHSEEAEDDDDLRDVHRDLYDFMLALGEATKNQDWPKYIKTARKKMKRLRRAAELFTEIQPEISSHTNFQMAERSLRHSVAQIEKLLTTE